MDIRVKFIPEEDWHHGDSVWALAYVKDDTCIMYFPAEWGFPQYGTIKHEFMHCADLHFHD